MLALVGKPHIEISLQGENVGELVEWIRKKYDVIVLVEEPEEEFIPIDMVSDYEHGRRTYSDAMAKRLSKTLNIREEHLRYGSEQEH